MFLNYLKNIFTKKRVKKRLSNVDLVIFNDKIQTVGIIFDENYYDHQDKMTLALDGVSISSDKVQVLVLKNKVKKSDNYGYPVFTPNDLSWRATFDKSEVRDFVAQEFDLLINYYDVEKSALLIVSHLSRARFKVGFTSVDKKLNHFMIDSDPNDHQVFIDELIKYLKILNKI